MESIDIFDTAIFRKVYEPKDIFKIIENEIGKDFCKKRIRAENEAFKKYTHYCIEQIYEFLPEFNYNYEIETEFKYCYANPTILEMYNKNPSNYIFISDMYLHKSTLKKLLEDNGYSNPKVFVSCDHHACKGDGSLFRYVLNLYNITKHYGDNYKCDIVSAKQNNIEPVFLPCLQNKNVNLPCLKNPLLKKYIAESYRYPIIERLAMWYAPLVYAFTQWCLENRTPEQTLYFLSRDMYLPFNIAKKYFDAGNIKYLNVSRRSLTPLVLQKSLNKELKDHLCMILTPEEIEQKRYEDLSSCIQYLKDMGLKNNDIIVDVGYSGTVQAALQCLDINLQGLYMQVDSNKYLLPMKSYFNRRAFNFLLLTEFALCSDEDNIEGYKNNKPLFVEDNKNRKEYARIINKTIMNNIDRIKDLDLDVSDIEQIIIHLQYYPDDELLELFNSKIFTNRERVESGINFNKEEIMKGNLFECYDKSYARPLFKKLLEKDIDLAYLSKYLA